MKDSVFSGVNNVVGVPVNPRSRNNDLRLDKSSMESSSCIPNGTYKEWKDMHHSLVQEGPELI